MNNSIYVNMTPNPLDLQQLSCSQGDTSSRKFQFTLHNQGEVYDLSNISDPVFTSFPVSAGGTEELLPTSTSTPATSPIVADIRYPDGLRQEESFTYRESPTTLDGNAKIKALYGNSLAWNQQAKEINSTNYTRNVGSVAWGTNTATVTATATSALLGIYSIQGIGISGHKYLFIVTVTPSFASNIQLGFNNSNVTIPCTATKQTLSAIVTSATDTRSIICYIGSAATNATIKIENLMCIDLTQMGLDISDPSEFTSLFPLSYYPYTTGELLDFKGTEIKTTGKNLCPKFTSGSGANLTYTVGDDGSVKVTGTNTGTAFYAIQFTLPAGTYVLSGAPTNGQLTIRSAQGGGAPSSEFSGQLDDYGNGATFTVSATATAWLNIRSTARAHNETYYPMIRYVDSDNVYEPHKESSLSLPISQYFTNGMRSAGNVRDELTDNKKTVRVGTRAYQSGDENDSTLTTDGINTNYPLATPAVESIMSATLVTENGEAPLYHNGDVLECECNSDISSEAGFFDAKIGFTDSDGTNYSNKIQLHVERSPQ